MPSFEKTSSLCQGNLPQVRVVASSSRNAANFSSARTTKRFLSRCASAIQIVRPLESIADTQPQLQPALLRLSAMIFMRHQMRRNRGRYEGSKICRQPHGQKSDGRGMARQTETGRIRAQRGEKVTTLLLQTCCTLQRLHPL
jgi:hypothetical protein